MKECIHCHEEKELTEFYKHKEMADGRTGSCKKCQKARVKGNREKKLDYYAEYERKRQQTPERREAGRLSSAARRRNDPERVRSEKDKWQAKNKDKRAAHVILGNAVRDGRVEKPDACSVCGNSDTVIHGHHEDYSLPLQVIWCCPLCHKSLHS